MQDRVRPAGSSITGGSRHVLRGTWGPRSNGRSGMRGLGMACRPSPPGKAVPVPVSPSRVDVFGPAGNVAWRACPRRDATAGTLRCLGRL